MWCNPIPYIRYVPWFGPSLTTERTKGVAFRGLFPVVSCELVVPDTRRLSGTTNPHEITPEKASTFNIQKHGTHGTRRYVTFNCRLVRTPPTGRVSASGAGRISVCGFNCRDAPPLAGSARSTWYRSHIHRPPRPRDRASPSGSLGGRYRIDREVCSGRRRASRSVRPTRHD